MDDFIQRFSGLWRLLNKGKKKYCAATVKLERRKIAPQKGKLKIWKKRLMDFLRKFFLVRETFVKENVFWRKVERSFSTTEIVKLD